ncbi:MAG: GGDEF domain-containing protein [Desulfomonilia bacterium]|uniref:Response regulator PleD n=1 Tax=anaerobic digester metagenome TaxID=1263854 RepID=A0A485M2G6_9ZZZZ|nr:GGDEF domain-containing protein [Pseudomonadota bacterium]HON39043.1 GGDEF domain-containing protein [Deltaproteobacteria bacterium]HRS56561.1 GGDEF domain-containing protein [Desulfomonilia bacterium]HPD21614.1 GGDEF domain-containing protein [Deltaproteobacteria bacterium]HPX19515.1 GGDEF domain-containing protein [Deltaproteobacteria bacterium]
MFIAEAEALYGRESGGTGELSRHRTLALFTESIVSLMSSNTLSAAMIDLLSLMGQTFPQAGPAVYITMTGSQSQAYSVLDGAEGGFAEAKRVLGNHSFSYTPVKVGGHPPLVMNRLDLPLMETAGARVVLSINSGIHDGMFREWVKILTPAVGKFINHEILLHMAYRDGLTGLLNYRAFEEMIRAELDRARRYSTTFSVMMADIDWFKKINDGFGHQIGDLVLKTLADRLNRCVRKSDRVFRYGGEEFAILLPHTVIGKARNLAERLRCTIEKTEFVAGLHITLSIGISEYRNGLSHSDLIKQADKGLYLAKERGRNRVEVMKGGA